MSRFTGLKVPKSNEQPVTEDHPGMGISPIIVTLALGVAIWPQTIPVNSIKKINNTHSESKVVFIESSWRLGRPIINQLRPSINQKSPSSLRSRRKDYRPSAMAINATSNFPEVCRVFIAASLGELYLEPSGPKN